MGRFNELFLERTEPGKPPVDLSGHKKGTLVSTHKGSNSEVNVHRTYSDKSHEKYKATHLNDKGDDDHNHADRHFDTHEDATKHAEKHVAKTHKHSDAPEGFQGHGNHDDEPDNRSLKTKARQGSGAWQDHNESFHCQELLDMISEKTEEYKAHRTTQTGRNFHTDAESAAKITSMKDGDKADVHVMHYSEGGLKKLKLGAHRVGSAVHLHTKDGTHIDSIVHS